MINQIHTKKTLGIIGFGQFGRLIKKHLENYFEIVWNDQEKGVPIEEAASKEMVIIAVPIQEFESVIRRIKNKTKKNALIIDVCSVKVKPVKIMKRLLQRNVQILATHPLFGPQSSANGLKGLSIVLCPVRIHNLNAIKDFLEKLGLKVIISNAKEHDKQMAKTQALTHLIGRALNKINFKEVEMMTSSSYDLLKIKECLKDDSLELFNAIQHENPFAQKKVLPFVKVINQLVRGKNDT